MNIVTKEFIHKFAVGSLVDLKDDNEWTGPHRITRYDIDPRTKDSKPAVYVGIDIGQDDPFGRWMIEGERQIIRLHIPPEQRQRIKAKRVKQ
jgi:hypothetical protein